MRELQVAELDQVSGGFVGTKIPFANGFTPGESIRGRPAGVIGAAITGWGIGKAIGTGINEFNDRFSGMSLGVAVFRSFNGGSRVTGGGGGSPVRIPVTSVEEM